MCVVKACLFCGVCVCVAKWLRSGKLDVGKCGAAQATMADCVWPTSPSQFSFSFPPFPAAPACVPSLFLLAHS